MNIIALFLKRKLVKLRFTAKTDISTVVVIVELLEIILDKFISHILVDHAAVLRIYNEDYALSEYIVMA